jgi:hypothetical protein
MVITGRDPALDRLLKTIGEGRQELRAVGPGEVLVVYDNDLPRLGQRAKAPPDFGENARANGDVVRVALEPDRDDIRVGVFGWYVR